MFFWNTSSSTYIPKLDQVLGKVVILQDYSGGVTGIRYSRFNIQDDYSVNTNWDLYDKWLKVKSHLQNANRNPGSSRGYINYLSASGGSFTYFISSGHMSNGTGASRLSPLQVGKISIQIFLEQAVSSVSVPSHLKALTY